MNVSAQWAEGQAEQEIEAKDIEALWRRIEADAARPLVLVLRAGGAEISAVIGDPGGTVLPYFPPGYEAMATGSLHSVGDAAAAERDDWTPPLTAYNFGHHTEFPRWSVIPHGAGREALAEFCLRPESPPPAVSWGLD